MVDFLNSSGLSGFGTIAISKFTTACLKGCAAMNHTNRSCPGQKCGERCKGKCTELALKVASGEMGPADACTESCRWREVRTARKDDWWTDKPCQNACNTEVGKLVEADVGEGDLTCIITPDAPGCTPAGASSDAAVATTGSSLLLPIGLGVGALVVIGGIVYIIKRKRAKKSG